MLTSSFLALLLLQPTCVSHRPAESRGVQIKLQAKITNYTLTADTFLLALTRVCGKFEIPMGIEWVKSPKTLRNVNHTWQHATVYRVIESLVRGQPGYSFEVRNGVVHVFPKGALRDRHNFLNIRIEQFEVQNEHIAVASRLRLYPLVHHVVSPPVGATSPESEGGTGYHISTGSGDERVSFKSRNITVRGILDRFSLAAGLKIWIVTYPEKPTLTVAGFRRTGSLYRDAPLPDEYQPLWEFLPWGVEPPRK